MTGTNAEVGTAAGSENGHGRVVEWLESPDGNLLVIVESPDGSAGGLIELVVAGSHPVARARGAEATRARVGGTAEELELDGSAAGEGMVVVVEEAQWADPTSLGRLQRLLGDPGRNLLVVVAHRPGAGAAAWGVQRLAEGTPDASVLHLRSEAASAAPALPSDLEGADLILAASLAGQEISVPVAARLLGVSQPEALVIAERLVARGYLGETRTGFRCTVDFDAGEARAGYVAARLADAMEAENGTASVIGHLRLAAGDPASAFPHLTTAVSEAESHRAPAEAFQLAETALAAAATAGVDDRHQLGHLHLVCARFLRSAGRSEWATTHIEKAASMLEGIERIDALGFAAALADDRQRPQEAETILAAAEWEAQRALESGKLGSLSSFRARSLHRIGFTLEADAMLDKATVLLAEGEETPRFYAAVNKAWILFDRGQVARAELEFGRLAESALRLEGPGSLADKEAWRARALFASGHPAEALEAVSRVHELAGQADVEAPLFLAELAMVEGNLAYGRHEEALQSSERVLDLVERQFSAWENVARAARATALLRLGRLAEAGDEIDRALECTPAGADGWRLRVRCLALEAEIGAAAGQPWKEGEAEDLADHMLQSQLYGWAGELFCVIAERRRHVEAAREAMAIGVENGNPMLAARAAAAGGLWRDPAAAGVARSVKAIAERMPAGWEEAWRAIPAVQEALEAPEQEVDEERQSQAEVLQQALRRAGLAGVDVVLSPAQRRARGLVRRRRVIRPLQVVAAALVVVVVAAGTALAVSQLRPDPPVETVVVEVTSPPAAEQVLSLEETELPPPGERVTGDSFFRGDQGRSGLLPGTAGVREVNGYYWRFRTAASIDAAPVAYGSHLLVGGTDGTFYALDQTSGTEQFRVETGGDISTAPGMGRVVLGEGQASMQAIIVSHSGTVRARDALRVDRAEAWSLPLGSQIRSSPVVHEGVVAVATYDPGVVYGLDLSSGTILWRYPDPDEPDTEPSLGLISASLALDDEGIVYVATEQGELHLVDIIDGSLGCVFVPDGEPITADPVVAGGVVYVPTRGFMIHALPQGTCSGTAPNRLPFYVTERTVDLAPAIAGDTMYLPDGNLLYAIDLRADRDVADLWPPSTVYTGMGGHITAAPVVADDTVYFGTADGVVWAVDATDGETLWTWHTENTVRGSPAVVDGVVFIASRDGWVYAVGP